MFAPPTLVPTEIFARVPEALRIRNRQSPWASTYRPGRQIDCFLEGPSFDRAGNLYVVDLAWGRIFRISPAGVFAVAAEYDGQPNGLKIHKDGRIFVADRMRGIVVLEPASGKVETIVGDYAGKPFLGVNDLIFAGNGDLYFTDQGMSGLDNPTGRVFRLRADGELGLLVGGLPSPNGIALDRSESTVFVNVTRDNSVWRVPLNADGSASRVGAFVRLSGGTGPDGLAIDMTGGLAIAHLGLGVVWLVSSIGEPLARVQSCTGTGTTNVAYGGDDTSNLYITESDSGHVLRARMPEPGWPLFSHR